LKNKSPFRRDKKIDQLDTRALEDAAASEKSASQLRDAIMAYFAIDQNRRRRNVSSKVSSSSASLYKQ